MHLTSLFVFKKEDWGTVVSDITSHNLCQYRTYLLGVGNSEQEIVVPLVVIEEVLVAYHFLKDGLWT